MFSPTMPMNTEWFKQRLADRKLSQRKLAKHMGLARFMDQAKLGKILSKSFGCF